MWNTEFTDAEKEYLQATLDRMKRLSEFLQANTFSDVSSVKELFKHLSHVSATLGNLHNDMSFIASLLSKYYLVERFRIEFDAAEKPQGAPGLDIDCQAADGTRIVGEIKTTVPYKDNDFGSNQKETFKDDFKKLSAAEAERKFMFVTDGKTFDILQKEKYASEIRGVQIVNLISGDEHLP